jgi:hypothetical protein
VASAIGFLVYFDLLERLGPIEINLVSYVAPVFAALTGWAFLGELPTVYTVVGFVVIFAGFLLLKRESLRRELPRIRRVLSWPGLGASEEVRPRRTSRLARTAFRQTPQVEQEPTRYGPHAYRD